LETFTFLERPFSFIELERIYSALNKALKVRKYRIHLKGLLNSHDIGNPSSLSGGLSQKEEREERRNLHFDPPP
jgi:hypothetical protein